MKNRNGFFLTVTSAIFFLVGMVLMLFSNTLVSGAILSLLGFSVATYYLSNRRKFFFNENFLFISSTLSLIILTYLFFIAYSRNIVIISSSFFALNFLIQVNSYPKKRVVVVKSKKGKTIKKAIAELKEEIRSNSKTYFYTINGKSFHLAGCIGLSRTKKENIKTSTSRDGLIGKGYKTCKICNS